MILPDSDLSRELVVCRMSRALRKCGDLDRPLARSLAYLRAGVLEWTPSEDSRAQHYHWLWRDFISVVKAGAAGAAELACIGVFMVAIAMAAGGFRA